MQVSCYRTNRKAPYGGDQRFEGAGLSAPEAEGQKHNRNARETRATTESFNVIHRGVLSTMGETKVSSSRNFIKFDAGETNSVPEQDSESRSTGKGIRAGTKTETDRSSTEPILRDEQKIQGFNHNGPAFSRKLKKRSRRRAFTTSWMLEVAERPEESSPCLAYPTASILS